MFTDIESLTEILKSGWILSKDDIKLDSEVQPKQKLLLFRSFHKQLLSMQMLDIWAASILVMFTSWHPRNLTTFAVFKNIGLCSFSAWQREIMLFHVVEFFELLDVIALFAARSWSHCSCRFVLENVLQFVHIKLCTPRFTMFCRICGRNQKLEINGWEQLQGRMNFVIKTHKPV